MEDTTKQPSLNAGLIVPKEEIIENIEITYEDDCEDSKEFIVPKEELSNSSLHLEDEYDQTVMPIKTELTMSKEISQIRSQQEMLEQGESSGYVEIKVEPVDEASVPAPEPSCSSPLPEKELPVRAQRGADDGKPYRCHFCDYRCKFKSKLVLHARTHTGEKPHSCGLCQMRFSHKSSLIKHSRTHSGVKPYACTLCQSKFAQLNHLSTHMKTHTGKRPFSCDECQATFTKKYHLANHMNGHTGYKPYCCDVCQVRFGRKYYLTTHMRTHTREKPFACELCDARFTCKSHLNRHNHSLH